MRITKLQLRKFLFTTHGYPVYYEGLAKNLLPALRAMQEDKV